MKLKKIFNQFSPDFFFLIPMMLIATILKIIWLSISISSNWLPKQTFFIFNLFKNNIVNIIFKQTKIKAAPWIPILTGIFILILSMKFLGLLPYTFTSTSHISMTYSIGVPLWMSVNFLGFYSAFQNRLSHLVPQGTPSYLIPFMVIIETLSLFAQPMALGLRLAAKLTAGHLLIFLISTAIWSLSKKMFMVLPALLVFSFLFILEVAVACIQTYVFTSLMHFFLVQNL